MIISISFQAGKIHLSDTSFALLRESTYFDIVSKGKTELKVMSLVILFRLDVTNFCFRAKDV